LDGMMEYFHKYVQETLKTIHVDAQKTAEDAHKEVVQELIPEFAKEIKKIYAERDVEGFGSGAVAEWYGAYKPRQYHRKESLYNLMEIDEDAANMRVGWGFSDANMTKDRKGGSLFEKVFVQGWHGGSPDPDTGEMIYPFGHLPAVQTESALSIFNRMEVEVEQNYRDKIVELTQQRFAQKWHELHG